MAGYFYLLTLKLIAVKNFTFYSPTYFVFGKGKESATGHLVKRFGGSRVLVHYGGGSVIKSGLLGRVIDSLKAEDLYVVELGGVRPNPRSGLVYEGISLCREHNIDFILAVGGGSAIDSAKAIAAGVPYEGDFWDFYQGKMIEKALRVATVLTIAAAGSEGSPNTVITHEEGMFKRGASGEVLRPVFSILNPALTTTLTPFQTACGIVDMMAHLFERYFTNTPDVEITDNLCEAVLTTIIGEAPKVMADPHNYEARANIMWAGMLAHNDICGAGREQDWSSHQLEHELSAMHDVAHGAGLAVICPAWMKYVMANDVARFAQFAVRIWGCRMDFAHPENTAREGIARLEQFFRSLGMPLTLEELGFKASDIPALTAKVGLHTPTTVGRFVPLTREDIARVYKLALSTT